MPKIGSKELQRSNNPDGKQPKRIIFNKALQKSIPIKGSETKNWELLKPR
jgi:hypothetical protein